MTIDEFVEKINSLANSECTEIFSFPNEPRFYVHRTYYGEFLTYVQERWSVGIYGTNQNGKDFIGRNFKGIDECHAATTKFCQREKNKLTTEEQGNA